MAKKNVSEDSDRPSKRPVRQINEAKACSSFILVELLEAQEVLNTRLSIGKDTKIEAPQAYILDIGPGLDTSKVGFSVGSRIILSGGFVPVPKGSESERQKGIIEQHSVKAVLLEGEELQCPGVSLILPGE